MLFYPFLAALLAGLALRVLVQFPVVLLGVPLIAAAVLLFAQRTRHPTYGVAGICLLAFAFGAVRSALAPQELPPAFMPLLGTKVALAGKVVADPDERQKNVRVTLAVHQGFDSTAVLAVLPLGTKVAYGDTLSVSGKFSRPKSFESDGGRTFRYDHYLEAKGIFALMQPATATILSPPRDFDRIAGHLFTIKDAFSRGLERALPEPEAALAEGLITGGKQGLDAALLAAFTVAGIVQIVVLSGYNVSLVVNAVIAALSWLPKRIALGAASLCIIAFVFAADAGSSAVRAALMACLGLLAAATGRSYDALRALTVAVALMALWNPYALTYDPSFQLSVLATYGLLLGVPIVSPWLGWIGNAALREAAATTIAAECAVLPLLLWQTGNLSLVSVPANVLVSFLVPGAMAASALAGFVGMALPGAARIVGLPAFALLWVIVRSAEGVAALPFAQIILPAFSWVFALCAYAGEAWLVYSLTPARGRNGPRTPSS